jgi:hypothetical protein
MSNRWLVLWYDGNQNRVTVVQDNEDGHLPLGDLESGCEWLRDKLCGKNSDLDCDVLWVIQLEDSVDHPAIFSADHCSLIMPETAQ